jgi:hypothetical protein
VLTVISALVARSNANYSVLPVTVRTHANDSACLETNNVANANRAALEMNANRAVRPEAARPPLTSEYTEPVSHRAPLVGGNPRVIRREAVAPVHPTSPAAEQSTYVQYV